jgi:hypothetical protein
MGRWVAELSPRPESSRQDDSAHDAESLAHREALEVDDSIGKLGKHGRELNLRREPPAVA